MAKGPVRYQAAASMEGGDGKVGGPAPAKQFVTYTRTSEGARKRNQKGSGGWLKSPGSFEPFVDGYRALLRIAQPVHLVDGHLRRVRVGGFPGEKRIYVWSTYESDLDGVEVKRSGDAVRINVAEFLAQIKLRPPVGVAERFDLVPADSDSPVQPALMIDLDKPLERKYFEHTKKKKSGQSANQGTATPAKPEGAPKPQG